MLRKWKLARIILIIQGEKQKATLKVIIQKSIGLLISDNLREQILLAECVAITRHVKV